MDINFGDDNAKMTEALVEKLRLLHPQGQAEGVPTDLDHELQRALADDEEWQRASEIERLTPGLSPEQLRSALKATLAIYHHWALNRALRALVPRLTPDLLASALEAMTSIGDVAVRSEALGILAPWLPPALLPSALDAASAIRDDLPRVEALGELAGLLSPTDASFVLDAALEATRACKTASDVASALVTLAPAMPALLPRAVDAVANLRKGEARTKILSALAPPIACSPTCPRSGGCGVCRRYGLPCGTCTLSAT